MWKPGCIQVFLAVAVSSATGASAAASEMQSAGRHFRARRAERHGPFSHGVQAAHGSRSFEIASFLALQGRQAPPLVETVSMANLTEPTATPPPPPALDPYKDIQPLDTRIGNFFVKQMVEAPTMTPPPSQAVLDLAYGCPTMLNWPVEVTVDAPDPCGDIGADYTGKWTNIADSSHMVSWTETCSFFDLNNRDAAPLVSYVMPNGDLLGASQEKTTIRGTLLELKDCSYKTRYTVQERLIHQNGKADDVSCTKYGSCDGVVYIQYVMKDGLDQTVAITPYLNLFPESFKINDPAGNEIATVSRAGWDPMHPDCTNKIERTWQIRFADSPQGVFSKVTERQWIAMMMTMVTLRDNKRTSTGGVAMSDCQIFKFVLTGVSIGLFVCCACGMPILCYLLLSAWMHEKLHFLEKRWCPRKKKGGTKS